MTNTYRRETTPGAYSKNISVLTKPLIAMATLLPKKRLLSLWLYIKTKAPHKNTQPSTCTPTNTSDVFRCSFLFSCSPVFATLALACNSLILHASTVEADDPFPTAPPPTYVFWQGEAADGRKPYEAALMKLIFEVSKEKYGPAELVISQRAMSTKRALKMMQQGEGVHIQIAPFLLETTLKDAITVLPYSVYKNLLGYRRLLVRPDAVEEFSKIHTKQEYMNKIVGQGLGWADVKVYEYNDIKVVESPRFDGLFPMLYNKRFDYIALGVNEARNPVGEELLNHYPFKIVENLIVYYPWPMHILVSKVHPDLVERLDYGMKQAIHRGLFDDLFLEYFSVLIDEINRPGTKLIILKTPNLRKSVEISPILFRQDAELK